MKSNADLNHASLKDLPQNLAALLCYVGGWVTGIIFLILEQKNRFVRFHALQSIIVFGTLTLAGTILEHIPYVGTPLGWIIAAFGFALWLILIIKASSGQNFKMPLAGDLAEKLISESLGQPAVQQNIEYEKSHNSQPQESAPAHAAPAHREIIRARYYTFWARTARVVGSSFAIAWSTALLIFFNFFNQYIAFYQQSGAAGKNLWYQYPIVNADFNAWLPIVNTVLAFSIIGHILIIIFDRYVFNQIVHLVLSLSGMAAVIALLAIFPFNFAGIPDADVAFVIQTAAIVTLIVLAVGFGVGALVRFIRLVVNVILPRGS